MSLALPIDILYSILEHMDQDIYKPDLAMLCRVNRVFKEAAESVLYRNITMPLPKISRVCVTLACERLALHVRHFETSKKPGWKPRDARELLHMRNALRRMKRLRVLRIHFGGPLGWLLDGCAFDELKSMLCNLSCDYHLASFFKRQAKLTDVTLFSKHTDHFPCTIDHSCFPNLRRISADPIWLRMLVPNRPVANIDVWDFIESPLGITGTWDIDWLSQPSSPVTTLSVSESFLISRGSARVAALVPHLTHLKIICNTPDLFSDEETEKRDEFTTWVSITLGLFRSLDAVEVHFRGSLAPSRHDDPLLRQFVICASEHAFDLDGFVLTFARSSKGTTNTTFTWHRIYEECDRESSSWSLS